MSEVKGLKKLNKAISKELATFGIAKAECTGEYSYVFADETVTFKLTEGTIEDDLFDEFVRDRFGYNIPSSFVFSLLHEVGHHKANDNIIDDVYSFCLAEKERIEKEMEFAETIEEVKKLEFQYFNLPDEIMATQWAVKYSVQHPQEIEKMWVECEKALHKFYRKNEVQ
jgi:hypothetical protein